MGLNKLEIFPSPWPLLKHNAFWQKKIGKKEMNWELFFRPYFTVFQLFIARFVKILWFRCCKQLFFIA